MKRFGPVSGARPLLRSDYRESCTHAMLADHYAESQYCNIVERATVSGAVLERRHYTRYLYSCTFLMIRASRGVLQMVWRWRQPNNAMLRCAAYRHATDL
jgi:hypothetical protein